MTWRFYSSRQSTSTENAMDFIVHFPGLGGTNLPSNGLAGHADAIQKISQQGATARMSSRALLYADLMSKNAGPKCLKQVL